MSKKPQYRHDCDNCKFHGEFRSNEPAYRGEEAVYSFDLYTCSILVDVSVILRYGDDGPDYMSAPAEIAEGIGEGRPLRQAWEFLQAKEEDEGKEMAEQQADERVWRRKQ
jgi:hypothetical protein